MNNHLFILTPNSWQGEGTIQLNMVEEELQFYTNWKITEKDEKGKIECVQQIEVKGLSELMHNGLLFFDFSSDQFTLQLDNPSMGKVLGKGVMTDQTIAWEFRVPELGFEGFEIYEKQADNSYLMHAEYATNDQLRTVIKGKICRKE